MGALCWRLMKRRHLQNIHQFAFVHDQYIQDALSRFHSYSSTSIPCSSSARNPLIRLGYIYTAPTSSMLCRYRHDLSTPSQQQKESLSFPRTLPKHNKTRKAPNTPCP